MTRITCALAVSLLALNAGADARAGTLWTAVLTGAGENPPTGSTFTGRGFLILNDAQTSASVTWTHNISTALTGGHIHRGPAGVNGPIILPFPNPTSPGGPVLWAIPAADVTNLKNAGLYMNFHNAQFPGGIIRGQMLPALLAPAAVDQSQLRVANALDVSAGFTADLDSILMTAAAAGAAERTALLTDLSGATLYSPALQATGAIFDQQQTLLGQAGERVVGPNGGVLFATLGGVFGQVDGQVGMAGADVGLTTLLGGGGHQFDGGLIAGAALGYATGDHQFDGGGQTDAQTTSAHVFLASPGGGRLLFTAEAGYGWSQFDVSRKITALSRTATASPEGTAWSLAARVAAPLSPGSGFSLVPYAQIDAQHAEVDAYTETGADSVSLMVGGQDQDTTTLELGAGLDLPLQGGGLTASFAAGWRYALDDGKQTIATSFVGSPVAFQTLAPGQSKNAAHLEAGLSGHLSPNLTLAATYRGYLADGYDTHAVQLRLALAM